LRMWGAKKQSKKKRIKKNLEEIAAIVVKRGWLSVLSESGDRWTPFLFSLTSADKLLFYSSPQVSRRSINFDFSFHLLYFECRIHLQLVLLLYLMLVE